MAGLQIEADPRRYFEHIGEERGAVAEAEPVCLYLETTNRCNLLCTTCPLTFSWNLEIQMRAARAGLRIVELPVAYRRRTGGVFKVSGSLGVTLKVSWRILLTIVRVALERRRPPTATAPAPGPAR